MAFDQPRHDSRISRVDSVTGVQIRAVSFNTTDTISFDNNVQVVAQIGRAPIEHVYRVDNSPTFGLLECPFEIHRYLTRWPTRCCNQSEVIIGKIENLFRIAAPTRRVRDFGCELPRLAVRLSTRIDGNHPQRAFN